MASKYFWMGEISESISSSLSPLPSCRSSVFEGHFEHGRRMGAGTYKSTGRGKPVFEGMYVDGFPEGEGTVTWLNGTFIMLTPSINISATD